MATENTMGRADNKPGLYRHPESGAEIFVTHHPKLGSAMADGAVAQGYVFVTSEMPVKAEKQKQKPVSKMNKEELEQLAQELGASSTDEMTNAQLKQYIKGSMVRS